MAFTVIALTPALAAADRARALAAAPPCPETSRPYRELIGAAGWSLVEHVDVTRRYAALARRDLDVHERLQDRLRSALGAVELDGRLARRRARVAAIGAGLLRRDLFVAAPS